MIGTNFCNFRNLRKINKVNKAILLDTLLKKKSSSTNIIMGDNAPMPVMEIESDHWCRTTSGDKASTTFTWTIEDFSNRPEKKEESIRSSSFTISGPNDKKTTWELRLFPRGDKQSTEEETCLFLENKKRTIEKITFELSILNERHQREVTESFTTEEVNLLYQDGYIGIGLSGLGSLEYLRNSPHLLPNGNLTVVCNLTVFGPEATLSGSKFPDEKLVTGDDCGKQMNEQIGKLLGNAKFSDVKVTCGKEAFHCHRSILSVRSPVFEAMFESNMRENLSQEVVIRDMRPDVVREMLHFIYNGATSTDTVMDEIGKDLLAAADQYQLDLLKNKCEEKLCSFLEVSNSLELLVLADLHHAFKLRNMALKLVAKNMDTFVNTDVYSDFARHHPDISVEITKLVAERDGAGIQ